MFTMRRLIIVATVAALMSGCANQNPYDSQGQAQQGSTGMSKTAKYGGLGALAGAIAGAAIDHDNRGKGALIGAAAVGAAMQRELKQMGLTGAHKPALIRTDQGKEFASVAEASHDIHQARDVRDMNGLSIVDRGIQTIKRDLAAEVAK
jgi:hypothetical protein